MSDGWVKWFQWEQGRLFNYGQMRKCEVEGFLKEFEAEAAKVLKEAAQITSCMA